MTENKLDFKVIAIAILLVLIGLFIFSKVDDHRKIQQIKSEKFKLDTEIINLELLNSKLNIELINLESKMIISAELFQKSKELSNEKRTSIPSQTDEVRLGSAASQLLWWESQRDTSRQY